MNTRLHSNIWKYALILISKKRIFAAILGAYYLTIPQVGASEVGVILLVGAGTGFLFEIPSGYVSDKLGHKRALVVSQFLIFISSLLFLLASDLVLLIVATALHHIGTAFHSGTGSAFMHETLKALGREKDYSSVMGKVSSLGFGVPIILMMLVPFLVEIDFKLPFLIAACLDLVGLIPALFLVTPPIPPEQVQEIGATNFRQVMREGWKLRFFKFALFSGIVGGVLLTVGGFRAPYQVILGLPIIWFGVLFGIGRVGASVLLAYSGKIQKLFTVISFYRFQLLTYLTFILILGFISNPWVVVVVFIIINALQWGLTRVNESFLLSVIRQSNFKATLLSASAQVEHLVAAGSALAVGLVIEAWSYQIGFLGLGVGLLVVMAPLYWYIKYTQPRAVPSAH